MSSENISSENINSELNSELNITASEYTPLNPDLDAPSNKSLIGSQPNLNVYNTPISTLAITSSKNEKPETIKMSNTTVSNVSNNSNFINSNSTSNSVTGLPSVITKKKKLFISENDGYNANDNSNSLTLPKKFRIAKTKKKKLKERYKKREERIRALKSKLQNKNYFVYYNNLSNKYRNASNINNNNIASFYEEYGITPTETGNYDTLQLNNRAPSLVRELGIKEALKIKKVNILEGESILKELEKLNEEYFNFFTQYKSKYRIRDKLDNIYQYGKKIPKKILEYFRIIKKKIYDLVSSIYGFVVHGFNYAFENLKHILLSMGGLILTFFKTSYGAIVWVYNKSGEIKSVFLNCIKNEPTQPEYNEDEINTKCDEYLDSITDTIKVVKKSLSKKKNEMIIMEDLELSACIIPNTESNNGYDANNNSNLSGGAAMGPKTNMTLIEFLFVAGLWTIKQIGKLALSTLCFSVKWSFRASLFVFKNTAVNLMKEGVFLVVPKNNKLIGYIVKYCEKTYDFLMQNEPYVYRMTKKMIDERNIRLINGPKVNFYHKTTSTAAGSIIKYQKFFRSERGGYFGNGIYFCSNPNSTHNKANPNEKIQTLLVSEVLVGEILINNSSYITFGDLLNKKCDTVRGIELKDNEYVVFSQDQICNTKDYTNPIGYWGYKGGKQSRLVLGHETKNLSEITHHNYWFPFENYGTKKLIITHPIVVNFNGPNAKIVTHEPWTGTEKDLYEIYKKYIRQKKTFLTNKRSKQANKLLVSKGLGNPYTPLTYDLFINLINTKVNDICDKNKKNPIHLDDRKIL
jgi:hypothetical protein